MLTADHIVCILQMPRFRTSLRLILEYNIYLTAQKDETQHGTGIAILMSLHIVIEIILQKGRKTDANIAL